MQHPHPHRHPHDTDRTAPGTTPPSDEHPVKQSGPDPDSDGEPLEP
jgi:hypothetical protein